MLSRGSLHELVKHIIGRGRNYVGGVRLDDIVIIAIVPFLLLLIENGRRVVASSYHSKVVGDSYETVFIVAESRVRSLDDVVGEIELLCVLNVGVDFFAVAEEECADCVARVAFEPLQMDNQNFGQLPNVHFLEGQLVHFAAPAVPFVSFLEHFFVLELLDQLIECDIFLVQLVFLVLDVLI